MPYDVFEVDLQPTDLENHMNLIGAMAAGGQTELAVKKTQAGIDFMLKNWKNEEANKLRDYLKYLESQKKQ